MKRTGWILVAIICFGAFAGAVATFGGPRPTRHAASTTDQQRIIETATPVLDAIRKYEKREGHPPNRLADLVPTYLPTLPVPSAFLTSGQSYLYRVDEHQWRFGVPLRGDRDGVLTYSSIGDYSNVASQTTVERVGAWGYYRHLP